MASGGNTHGSAFIICTKHSQLSWTFLPVNTHSRAGTQRKNLLKISNEPLKVICFMFMTSTLSSWPGQTLRWYHRVNVNLQQITCKKIGLIWLTQMPQERAGTGALLQGSKPRNSILCHFYLFCIFSPATTYVRAFPINLCEILVHKYLLITRSHIP